MIEIKDAVVSYREVVALKGISLNVAQGEFVGIVGPNGAGKTTLITAINGLTKLVSGDISVFGMSVSSEMRAIRKKIGYVPQLAKIDSRTPVRVREMVMMGRYGLLGFFKRPSTTDRQIVDEALELVGLKKLADRPVGHISAGEFQRVAIAHCLVQEPKLFLFDEPTTSLDWKAKVDILQLIKLINKARNLTVLFVSHDIESLPLNCERIVLMKDGIIWGDGSPGLTLTPENIAKVYELPLPEVKKRLSQTFIS